MKLISTKGLTKVLINRYSILNDAKYFAKNGLQDYLILQPIFKYFQTFIDTNEIFAWKSEGFSEDSITSPVTSDNSLVPKLIFIYNRRIGRKLLNTRNFFLLIEIK